MDLVELLQEVLEFCDENGFETNYEELEDLISALESNEITNSYELERAFVK